MKTIILKDSLRNGLVIVSRIAPKNLSLPILSSVLLSCEKNFVCLRTTDLEIGIKWWALAKVEREGKIACPLRVFQSLIDSLSVEKITLKTEEKSLFIETDNEAFRAQIKGMDPEEFPIIPEPETKEVLVIKIPEFVSGLSRVVEMAAVSMVKPEISGVYFRFSDNLLKMVATDSFRLAQDTISLENRVEKEIAFILPQRSCREIINIFGDKQGELKIYLSTNQILLETMMTETSHPKIHFFSRLIDGEYPNYQEIIPHEFRAKAVLPRSEFLQNLKTASLFSNKINEVKIILRPEKQEIETQTQSQEVGQSSSILKVKIEGEASEVSFNWRFLIDGLSQIKDKEITFALSKDDGPALLQPKEDENYLYLLMPLRT
jgi:DNA polymerase-3 subunit beta